MVRSVSGSQAVTGTVSSKQIVTRQWLPRIYIVLNLNTKQWHCTAELQGPAARVSSAAVIVLPLEPAPAVRSPNSLPRTHLLQLLPRSSASWDGAVTQLLPSWHRDRCPECWVTLNTDCGISSLRVVINGSRDYGEVIRWNGELIFSNQLIFYWPLILLNHFKILKFICSSNEPAECDVWWYVDNAMSISDQLEWGSSRVHGLETSRAAAVLRQMSEY